MFRNVRARLRFKVIEIKWQDRVVAKKLTEQLPEAVRTLIARKVALRWREQGERYATATRLAYSRLTQEIVLVLGTGKIRQALHFDSSRSV